MGIDLINPLLVLPRGVEPDWARAGAWIDNLDPAVYWESGDELFPLEYWFEEMEPRDDHDPSLPQELELLPAARDFFRRYASVLRGAIERPEHAGVLVIELPDYRVHAAAAPDGGEGPGELVDSFIYTSECGAARAAGFTQWSECCAVPLDERGLRMDPAGDLPAGRPIAAAAELPPMQPVDGWVAWMAVRTFDWRVADEAVGRAATTEEQRRELAEALEELRARLVRDEFSRMVLSGRIHGGPTIWTAADYMGGASTAAAIGKLGAAGVLEAAGVLGWGAPPELT